MTNKDALEFDLFLESLQVVLEDWKKGKKDRVETAKIVAIILREKAMKLSGLEEEWAQEQQALGIAQELIGILKDIRTLDDLNPSETLRRLIMERNHGTGASDQKGIL